RLSAGYFRPSTTSLASSSHCEDGKACGDDQSDCNANRDADRNGAGDNMFASRLTIDRFLRVSNVAPSRHLWRLFEGRQATHCNSIGAAMGAQGSGALHYLTAIEDVECRLGEAFGTAMWRRSGLPELQVNKPPNGTRAALADSVMSELTHKVMSRPIL
uniref:SNF2_N domain-containing protein n=1 Tax=Macrostomum lignano TaxID=282301 RepID=A0A1I8J6H3_9PLAT